MMPENTTSDFDFVLQNPANYYRRPAEIAQDPQLSHEERLKLVEEWHTDISHKLTADEEGMTPPHARDSANDAVLLEEISATRENLGDEEPEQGGVIAALARLWHRL